MQMLGGDPDSSVFNRNCQVSVGVYTGVDRNYSLMFSKFHAIRQDIEHNLSQLRLINMDKRCRVCKFTLYLNRFLMRNRIDSADCRLNQFPNTNELLLKIDLARFDSRKIEQPIYNV